MRARHVVEGDGFSILASHPHLTVASIVSEAVLNADDNPVRCVKMTRMLAAGEAARHGDKMSAHQRFVKTTPKPRATKKSSGEL